MVLKDLHWSAEPFKGEHLESDAFVFKGFKRVQGRKNYVSWWLGTGPTVTTSTSITTTFHDDFYTYVVRPRLLYRYPY